MSWRNREGNNAGLTVADSSISSLDVFGEVAGRSFSEIGPHALVTFGE